MKTSESTANLIKALKASQEAFPIITKDRDGQLGNRKYKYADLSTVLDAVKPVLLKNGLVLQHGMEANGHSSVTCRLSHVSGEWQESALNLPDNLTAQDLGSQISYQRRYSACAMLGIVTEDDDDGAAATKAVQQQATPKNYPLKPMAPVKPPAAQPTDEDRVPAEVTDGSAGAPAEDLEAVVLKAYSKPKKDKNSKEYRGVLLIHTDNSEKWWNLYHAESIANLQTLKGQVVQAKLEMKGEYPLCHKLEVTL